MMALGMRQHRSDSETALPRDHPSASTSRDVHVSTKVKVEGDHMTLTRKLKLAACLWGTDASVSFTYLYAIPVLQALGMPLKFTTLLSFVAAVVSVILIPLLGQWADRGANPQRRKNINMIICAAFDMVGLMLIILANIMHIHHVLDNSTAANASVEFDSPCNDSDLLTGTLFNSSDAANGALTPEISFNLYYSESSSKFYAADASSDGTTSSAESLRESIEKTSVNDSLLATVMDTYRCMWERKVSLKAGLAMLGFIMMDIGFEGAYAFMKTFLLAYSPASEHSSILVISLIVASGGGISTTTLGVIHFSALWNSSYMEGCNLAIQTSVQAVMIILFLILGLLISLRTGRQLFQQQEGGDLACLENAQRHSHVLAADVYEKNNYDSNATEFPGLRFHSEETQLLNNDEVDYEYYDNVNVDHVCSDEGVKKEEGRGEVKDNDEVSQSREVVQLHPTSGCTSYGSTQSNTMVSKHLIKTAVMLEDGGEKQTVECSYKTGLSDVGCGRHLGFKTKIFLIMLSTYFSIGGLLMFTMTSSDYVGKAIYGGQPHALPNSLSRACYEQGVRMASWGFFVYFGTYFLISFIHTRLLAFLGPRLEFVSIHLVMAASFVLAVVTERLESFFLLSVVSGIHRACAFAVPFQVANDIMMAKVKVSGDKRNQAGLVMSLVSMCIPLPYATLFTCIGALEEWFDDVSIPYYMGTVFCCLSALSFSFLGNTTPNSHRQ